MSLVLWSVEVELHGSRHPLGRRRLRKVVENDAEVIRASGRELERLVLRSAPPTIVVEVAADSPGAAAAKAEGAVKRALAELEQPPEARAWIVSTDGDEGT